MLAKHSSAERKKAASPGATRREEDSNRTRQMYFP